MSEQQSNYRQIMKSTSIFGGVQIFQIIIQIVKSKALAVLLGPAGIGINNLLLSTLQFIEQATNFGLKASAVKSISEYNSVNQDTQRVSTIIVVIKRLVWVTGLLGIVVTISLSTWLSKITFGSTSYTLAFIWVAVSLLFNQLSSGQLAVLQGFREIKHLAKANLAGAFLGLIFTLPLYYFWGIDGIVPGIIVTSFVNMFISWFFSAKVKYKKVNVSKQTTLIEGRRILELGFFLSLSSLISTGTSYFIRIYISNAGGLEQVGFFTAGFAIVGSYVGLVFTAMGTDYFPKLASVAKSNTQSRQLINQQAEIAILILAPIIQIFLVFANWVIIILYAEKFMPIKGMIHWTIMGVFFQAASWSIAYLFIAKGKSKLFFINELLANVYKLIFNIVGYKLGGLDGLGVSFLIHYMVYFLQVYLISRFKFEFNFTMSFKKIFIMQFILGSICFLLVRSMNSTFSYITGSMLIIISSAYSIYHLNKILDLKSIISNYTKNKK